MSSLVEGEEERVHDHGPTHHCYIVKISVHYCDPI